MTRRPRRIDPRWTRMEPADPAVPRAGYYRRRMAKGAPYSAIRIWFGPSFDPETGEWCDRSHFWRASVNGEQVPVDVAWPGCAGEPITRAEHDFMVADHRHAVAYEPHRPEANPRQRIELRTLALPF